MMLRIKDYLGPDGKPDLERLEKLNYLAAMSDNRGEDTVIPR
jgi:hypothetical protein